MSTKTINTRIQMKHDSTEKWSTSTFVPFEGEIIFYSDLNKIKIGDGSKNANELPFISIDKTDIIEFINHNHDEQYYTEKEIDSLISILNALLATKYDNSSGLPAGQIEGSFGIDLIPNTTNVYSLGTSEKNWKNIYLSGDLIFDTDVKINSAGITLKNNTALTDETNSITINDIVNHNHDTLYYQKSEVDSKIIGTNHTITANASDDDVVILTGTNGQNAVSYTASHSKTNKAGTYTKVTVNDYGHITSGENPTTLSDYGITDVYTQSEIDAKLTEATSSKKGLMSATDKTNLDKLVTAWTADGNDDQLINKVEEVVKAFENASEGTNIVTALANKADKVEATQEAAGLMSAEDKKFLEDIVIPSYGDGCTASGEYSHAEGYITAASGIYSHAEGESTTALEEAAHAEGEGTTASGARSHAEGGFTTASGTGSHAEGFETTASGWESHAEGRGTVASGDASHAGGYWTVAGYENQTVVGTYNNNKENTLFEVGKGTGEKARSNALEVLKDGRAKVYGTPTEDEDVVRKVDLATVATTGSYTDLSNKPTIPTVNNATLTLNVGGQTVEGNNAFTANDATNTTYNVPSATASNYGVVKVSSVNSSAVSVNSESTTTGRYYPVELNSDGKAIVNVPWTDTNTQDGNDNQKVKTGSVTFGANDVVEFVAGTNVSISGDATNKKITISATDTNTDTNTSHSHSAGVGLVGSGSAGTSGGTYNYKAKLRSETALTVDSAAATTVSGRVYPVVVDKSGYLAVNVPWTDTDTNTHNSHAVISGKKSNGTTDIKGSASSGDITLGDSGVTAGTYKRVTVNAKGIVVSGDNTDADTHYTKYLQIKGNGTEAIKYTQDSDKSLNLKPGTNVSISAASGEITINATDTTYTIATGDNNGQIKVTPSSGTAYNVAVKGLGSSAFVTNYKATECTSFTSDEGNCTPAAVNKAITQGIFPAKSDAYGTIKVSSVNSSAVTVNAESSTAGRYYPVELNSDGKAIVNVPWTDTNTDTNTKVNVTLGKTTKAYLLGTSTTPTSTAQAVTSIADTGVYLGTTAGQLVASSFYAQSDRRLKENIVPYSCDKSILDLPVYKYNFIKDETKTEHIGCIAQDLQKICPEVVCTDEDGYLSINENKLVYLLLDEVKKLRKELDELKNK